MALENYISDYAVPIPCRAGVDFTGFLKISLVKYLTVIAKF